jgi:hypothetical protein
MEMLHNIYCILFIIIFPVTVYFGMRQNKIAREKYGYGLPTVFFLFIIICFLSVVSIIVYGLLKQ